MEYFLFIGYNPINIIDASVVGLSKYKQDTTAMSMHSELLRGRAIEVSSGRKFKDFMKTIRFQTFLQNSDTEHRGILMIKPALCIRKSITASSYFKIWCCATFSNVTVAPKFWGYAYIHKMSYFIAAKSFITKF